GMEILLKIISLLFGLGLAVAAVMSAVRTFVLPRSVPDPVVRVVFRGLRAVFGVAMLPARTYAQRGAVVGFFWPVALLALLPAWLLMLVAGYTGMLWAAGAGTLYQSFKISGSSLLTLGIASNDSAWAVPVLEFSEATLGLIMVALLIAYLPTIYSAFAKRESAVSLLEVRAGSPPSATELIER